MGISYMLSPVLFNAQRPSKGELFRISKLRFSWHPFHAPKPHKTARHLTPSSAGKFAMISFI